LKFADDGGAAIGRVVKIDSDVARAASTDYLNCGDVFLNGGIAPKPPSMNSSVGRRQ